MPLTAGAATQPLPMVVVLELLPQPGIPMPKLCGRSPAALVHDPRPHFEILGPSLKMGDHRKPAHLVIQPFRFSRDLRLGSIKCRLTGEEK